jgi:lipid-A-disaccharide synthase
MRRVFLVAGELSGDTHGAGLMRSLRGALGEVEFAGLGGRAMREEGGNDVEDWVETAGVVGLWEVLKMYSFFKRKLEQTTRAILETRPAAVILVDYPGFNLRLAAALRAGGYQGRLIYYISPQVWAWKKGRVRTMARLLDRMICIFPFEPALYEQSGLSAVFAGHPMVDRSRQLAPGVERGEGLVGWFPGSRRNEVRRLLPEMLRASALIRQRAPDTRFQISAANETLATLMRELAENAGMPEASEWIETGRVYELMRRATAGAVASGTATLEAACLGLPYVLVYRVNWLTYLAGRLVVRIKRLGMVNILAGREVVREMVQHHLSAHGLAEEMLRLLADPRSRDALQSDLARVTATLGDGGAYDRAAAAVAECLAASSC